MNFRQFFLILRARSWIVLLTLLATVAAALAVSLLITPRYSAKASVVFDVRSADPMGGTLLHVLATRGYIATQAEVVASERVAQRAVKLLKLDERPWAKEQWLAKAEGKGSIDVWLADRLLKRIDVKSSREGNVITIGFTSEDPTYAAAVVNAFAHAYMETNVEMKAEPARQYAHWFEGQSKTLREDLEGAQKRLSAHQRQHGIVASEERFDIETAKLNELSTQLTVVVGQRMEAHSKHRSGDRANTLPEVVQNPLIQVLKSELARLEAKLQELAGKLGVNHPEYQTTAATAASLKERLANETQHITKGFATTLAVSKERESELRAAIEAQKRRIMEIKRARDELDVLRRDVDAAQRAYDMVSQRMHQTNLESKITQSDARILTVALEPTDPSFPQLALNTWISIFLGTLLGIAVVFLIEILDRRVRSTDDLTWLLQLPVLGAVDQVRLRGRYVPLPRKALTTSGG